MKEKFTLAEPFNLEDINDSIAKYEVPICYAGIANNFDFSKEVLDGMIDTIKGARVLTVYNPMDNDFMGHEDDIVLTNEGYQRTPKPWVIGFTAYDCDAVWKDFTFDGQTRTYLTAIVYLWKDAFPYLQDLKDKKVFQSMECELDFLSPDNNGIKKVISAKFGAITLLGSKVQPAFTGSTFIKFSSTDNKNQIEKFKQEYELLKQKEKYSNIDFSIPQDVKKTVNKGLTLRNELNKGGTKSALEIANYLNSNNQITYEKLQKINDYFSRHFDDIDISKKNNNVITYQLWGGLEAKKWSDELINKINNFSEKGGSNQVFDNLSMNQLCDLIETQLNNYIYTDNTGWSNYKYKMKDLKNNMAIFSDLENTTVVQIPYEINEENNIALDFNKKQDVLKDYKLKIDFSNIQTEKFIKKEDLGSKEKIEIDKSKDSMSDSAWGDVDKSELKKDCLLCSNWESVCQAVFLDLKDGWKDGKEGSLGYPVMKKQGNKVVYNRYALASAKAYAEKNNETAILAKVNDIYNKFGLNETKTNNSKKEDTKMSKDFKAMYSKMKDTKSKFSFDDADNIYALLDNDAQCIYLMEDGQVTKLPFAVCEGDETNCAFSVKEDKKEVLKDSTEMIKKFVEMSKENKKVIDDKDAEIGKAFSKISSLESALHDAENASQENAEKIKEYEKKFKDAEDENKKVQMSKILEKKEFSVFSADEKTELVNQSVELSLDDFENKVYAQFGKKVKDTINFSNDGKATGVSVLFTGDSHPQDKDTKFEDDDIYAQIRKEINK